MNATKPLQIFKPGRHTAMSGDVLDFTAADLSATAAAYDPAKHEAPIVVGHPRIDAPAYGWVKSLAGGAALEAEPHQVDAAFADMVAAGRFKKISASFFPPAHPANPVPGVWYLRHVGFLGAAPPAVKGLRTPEFGDDVTGIVEFADWQDETNAFLWRRLRDWILGKFGQEDADNAIPPYDIGALEKAAAQPSTDPEQLPGFSDPLTKEAVVTPEEKAALEAENAQLKAQIAASEARVAAEKRAAEFAARHAGHLSFADELVTAGRLLPAHRDLTVATLDLIAGQAQPAEFGEGDGRQPLVDAFKAFLQAQPTAVEFGEHATKASAAAAAETTDFAAPANMAIDGDGIALHRKALAHQAAHPGTDYLAAVRAVTQ